MSGHLAVHVTVYENNFHWRWTAVLLPLLQQPAATANSKTCNAFI